MFFHQDAKIDQLSVHRVGNKAQEEFYILSDHPLELNQDLSDIFKQYLLAPFLKSNEVYNFFHPSGDIRLNEIYHLSKNYFKGMLEFHSFSKEITKLLYDCSSHPKIKSGELYVAYMENVQFEGEDRRAIGIFKSENKTPFIKVSPVVNGFNVDFEENAINIEKLDKGVIIIDSDDETNYNVLVIDGSSAAESVMWKDDFIQVIARNDDYQKTNNFLQVYKSFVTDKLDDVFELDQKDKAQLLNASMDYFKTKETFDSEEFNEEVLNSEEAIALFQDYKENFETEFETEIGESFDISDKAVKKAASKYKSVIKLDKNFQIHILGKKDRIEKAFDEERGLNYYKLYFENES